MKKNFVFLTPAILLFFCFQKAQKGEGTCIRINHFFVIKHSVAEKYWPEFNAQTLFGPILYYSTNGQFVINPNNKINTRLKYTPLDNCINTVFIGLVSDKVDSSRFNMQVDYDEDDSTLVHYFNPVASVSDLVIAQKFVPQLRNTEEWMGMVLHETFHQYQTSFQKFRDCQNSTQKLLNRDTLITLSNENKWYKESTRKEYELLLNAVNSIKKDSIRYYINSFFKIRGERYSKTYKTWGLEIKELEDMLERSEGVARYMEYCMKRTIKYIPINKDLREIDTLYHPGVYANYDILTDPFLNKYSTQYVYSTGLTLSRLLEKLGINFQTGMYRNNISFETYLQSYLEETSLSK